MGLTPVEAQAVEDEPVTYQVVEQVALVLLNRPSRLNAWTPGLEAAYGRALRKASSDAEVRAVVVSGAGDAFCAGADTGVLDAIEQKGGSVDGILSTRRRGLEGFAMAVPKPVIAAVHGPCVGVGLAHALTCDLRFTTPTARWVAPYARLGLVAEHGTAWLIQRLAGPSTAADMLFTGRTVTGEEAHRLGLADRLVDDDVVTAAVAYAAEIASRCSPAALATIKQQLQAAAGSDLPAALALAEHHTRLSLSTADFAEGVRAFRDRRPPRFPALEADG